MTRIAAGDAYWIVACPTVDQSRENIFYILRSRVHKQGLVTDSAVMDVPLNMKFGSFDELIRLADDLNKHDTTCEQMVHRLERQILEIDPASEIKLIYQRSSVPMELLLRRFMWDDTRFARTRHLRDNLDILMASVARLDEEVRIKTAAYNESKHSHMSTTKTRAGSLIQRDLITILTPQIVTEDDFIESDYLTTLVVVIPTGGSKDWLKIYEQLDPWVVPNSTRKFDIVDNEGNSLWKVTLFRKSVENFKNSCKPHRFLAREFTYTPTASAEAIALKARLEAEKNKLESFLSRVCLTSFSDACVAWLHIKAMRVFVESVLRFGLPPQFSTFILKPRAGRERKLRKELEDIFTTEGLFGRAFIESAKRPPQSIQPHENVVAGEVAEEEYYSYVSLKFIPFQHYTQK